MVNGPLTLGLVDISQNIFAKNKEPKAHAFSKLRDKTNTFFVGVCLFKDETNSVLPG